MIKRISSRTVYSNKWMTVREDQIEHSNGEPGIYGVVDKPDFALIIPFDGDGLYLVNQYRYPVESRFWEFPQGSWESAPDADPLDVARGELKEETGLSCQSLVFLGHLYEAYGFVNQSVRVYLATGLTMGEQELDPEEEGLFCQRFSLSEVEAMIVKGDLKDTSSLAAYALWKVKEKASS